MATLWHCQSGDGEFGPIGFSDLVQMARDGRLWRSDLLRAAWLDERQRADTVVGLFYMANRAAVEAAQ